MKRRSILGIAAACLGPVGQVTMAQTLPSRPLKVLVAWPAGGLIDVVTRAMTDKLGTMWPQSVMVENKPGAYGLIGTEQVMQSAPDGHTWLIATMGTPMSASLYKRKWIAADEFAGVAILGRSALLAVVPASLPANTLGEFIALARSQPGKFNYLNPSLGSATHLNTELIKLSQRISMTSVMYNGQPPGVIDLVSGQLHFAMIAPQVAGPHIKSGKLRALAVAFPSRLKDYPDVPTMAEAGYADASVVAAYSVLVPKRTPRDVIARFNADINTALADAEVKRRIEAAGAIAAGPSTPEQVDAFMRSETQRWDRFFREVPIDLT